MDDILQRIVGLINRTLKSSSDESYFLELTPTIIEKELIIELEDACIQEINQNGKTISAQEIDLSSPIKIELSFYQLRRYGYYHSFENLINANQFSAPSTFYIKELNYFHDKDGDNQLIKSWFLLINLIDCLSELSIFQSLEDGKTLYFMQEKSALVLPLIYDRNLIDTASQETENIEYFIEGTKGTGDKKKIFLKELIDFLNDIPDLQRLDYLYQKFGDFYRNCEAAYGFFLSDFSYSKLKVELESAILDYSKNIRSIINDSQSRLIAIPAAFLVASTQLDLSKALSAKNCLIIISSFAFSILIEIFIRNQESSLKIFTDNVRNYKTTFKLKNTSIVKKENDTLQAVISSSFEAIDNELIKQNKRLNFVRYINWGMSIFLIILVIIAFNFTSISLFLKKLISLLLG